MSGKRKVITIDGLAATGKSSLAQSLGKRIGFITFSSGLLYRLAGYAASAAAINLDNEQEIVSCMEENSAEIILSNDGKNRAVLNGKDVTEALFTTEVSDASSKISAYPGVRSRLIDLQRSIFAGRNIIAEGRDMGTVIFPQADLKFFITVGAGTRIERRIAQQAQGKNLTASALNTLKRNMEIEVVTRDKRDVERDISPTIAAPDAIIIDNGQGTLTEVVEKMYDFVSKKFKLKDGLIQI